MMIAASAPVDNPDSLVVPGFQKRSETETAARREPNWPCAVVEGTVDVAAVVVGKESAMLAETEVTSNKNRGAETST